MLFCNYVEAEACVGVVVFCLLKRWSVYFETCLGELLLSISAQIFCPLLFSELMTGLMAAAG